MNECEITRDLIPGYADEVLSPSGREYVEAHTADCPECMAILEKTKATVVTGNVAENVNAKKPFKRVNFKKIIIISASALLAVMIVFFGVFAINDANSGYYNLNRLFGNDPYQGIIDEAIRQNSGKVLEVTGYDYEEFKQYAEFSSSTFMYMGIQTKMFLTYKSLESQKYYMIFVKGCPTGIGTYRIDEFVISGENENGSVAIINSNGELFCHAEIYNDYRGEITDTEYDVGKYSDYLAQDKDSFIADRIKEYADYWTLDQATEMAKSDWERDVKFREDNRQSILKSLREEYKIPEEVIEKWMSYAE